MLSCCRGRHAATVTDDYFSGQHWCLTLGIAGLNIEIYRKSVLPECAPLTRIAIEIHQAESPVFSPTPQPRSRAADE